MARFHIISVSISITTLNAKLAATMEPRTSAPHARLRAIRELSEAGVPVTAMVAPIIPGLTDSEVPAILEAVAAAGAKSASYIVLRLPWNIRPAFLEWLATNSASKEATRGISDSLDAERRNQQRQLRQPRPRRRPNCRSDSADIQSLREKTRARPRAGTAVDGALPPPHAVIRSTASILNAGSEDLCFIPK